jgi:hypothetical protein
VEVGAADCRDVDADDGVRRLDDDRIRNLLPGPFARAVVDERLMNASFFVSSSLRRCRPR